MSQEEEVLLACAAYITLQLASSKSKRKNKRWVRKFLEERSGYNALSSLQISDGSFLNFTRMTTTDFEHLLQLVGGRIAKDTQFRESVKPEIRLVITLRFLATGVSKPRWNIYVICPSTSRL
jgi:hypothetical protein